MIIRKNVLIAFLLSVVAYSCSGPLAGAFIASFITSKKEEEKNGINFANKVFVVNKVNTALSVEIAKQLQDHLIRELQTMTDSVKDIDRVVASVDYRNPDSVFTALAKLPSPIYLIHLDAGAEGGNNLLIWSYGSLGNSAGIDLSIFEVKTRQRIFHICVQAQESYGDNKSHWFVTSRPDKVLLNRALKKAIRHLRRHSSGLKKK